MAQGRTVRAASASALNARLADLETRVAGLEARSAVVGGSPARAATAVALGELLRRRRRELGHTQAVAGSRLGVDQATVSKWERGDQMGVERLPEIASYIELPLDDVVRLYVAPLTF